MRGGPFPACAVLADGVQLRLRIGQSVCFWGWCHRHVNTWSGAGTDAQWQAPCHACQSRAAGLQTTLAAIRSVVSGAENGAVKQPIESF